MVPRDGIEPPTRGFSALIKQKTTTVHNLKQKLFQIVKTDSLLWRFADFGTFLFQSVP